MRHTQLGPVGPPVRPTCVHSAASKCLELVVGAVNFASSSCNGSLQSLSTRHSSALGPIEPVWPLSAWLLLCRMSELQATSRLGRATVTTPKAVKRIWGAYAVASSVLVQSATNYALFRRQCVVFCSTWTAMQHQKS